MKRSRGLNKFDGQFRYFLIFKEISLLYVRVFRRYWDSVKKFIVEDDFCLWKYILKKRVVVKEYVYFKLIMDVFIVLVGRYFIMLQEIYF